MTLSDQKSPGALAVFQNRDFAAFFASRLLSSLSSQMIDVAVGWLVYQLTDSAFALGLVGLCIFAPNLIFALLAGHVADRFDRRFVLVVCYILMLSATFCLFVIAYEGRTQVELIFAIVAIFGTARAFSNPAGQALLPNLVSKDMFARAVATTSSAWQIATIAGPAIGGLLYGFGPEVVFLVTTIFYSACLVFLLIIRPSLRVRAKEKLTWDYLTAGMRYIWSNEVLLGSVSLDLFAVLLGGATALLPIYARDILFIGPFGLGLLRTMPAVGAFVTALVLAQLPDLQKVGYKMFIAVAIFGLATIGFGLSTNFYLSLFFLTILGAADMVNVFIRSTIVQIETPDEMRGRVSAVNSLFIGASNELGEFESGVLAGFVGAVPSVIIGGIGSLLITLLWARWFPKLRERNQLSS
jgi:MFS family permease